MAAEAETGAAEEDALEAEAAGPAAEAEAEAPRAEASEEEEAPLPSPAEALEPAAADGNSEKGSYSAEDSEGGAGAARPPAWVGCRRWRLLAALRCLLARFQASVPSAEVLREINSGVCLFLTVSWFPPPRVVQPGGST